MYTNVKVPFIFCDNMPRQAFHRNIKSKNWIQAINKINKNLKGSLFKKKENKF